MTNTLDDGFTFEVTALPYISDDLLEDVDTNFLDGITTMALPDKTHKNDELVCGQWHTYPDEKTGLKRSSIYKCRHWRICSLCFAERMEIYRQRVYRYACANDTCQLICNDNTWENLVKHELHGKQGFQRFPQSDGTNIVFLNAELGVGTLMEADTIHDLDWNAMLMTREKGRVSGNLQSVIVEPEIDTEPKVLIINCAIVAEKVDESGITITIGKEEDDLCYYEALAATMDLDPQTPEELQPALYQRINAYASALRRHGWQVKQRYHKRKIASNGYIWGKSLLTIFQRLVFLGLVKPEQKPYFKARTT